MYSDRHQQKYRISADDDHKISLNKKLFGTQNVLILKLPAKSCWHMKFLVTGIKFPQKGVPS